MTYAIGDIHGCNRTFCALLDALHLNATDRLILLGDYIDRGPDSKGVIDTVFRLRDMGHELVCLRGNHEQMLIDAMLDTTDREYWLLNGGSATMSSFGIQRLEDLPAPYLDFFTGTVFWSAVGDYLCVHGGPDFLNPDPLGQPERLLWMRRWYDTIDYAWLGTRVILHGHTPMAKEVISAQHAHLAKQQYLNLDNGCVYAGNTHRGKGLGNLVAFCLETQQLHWQANVE